MVDASLQDIVFGLDYYLRRLYRGFGGPQGAFGARIPVGTEVLEPDLLITPLLAWDRKGYRLGYGGGFYDRTLELLRAKRPTVAVGFAYSAQEVPRVPRESTDQRLNALVTEKEIHFFDS